MRSTSSVNLEGGRGASVGDNIFPKGARGLSSTGDFSTNLEEIGLRFSPGLSTQNVRVTPSGIERVRQHTSRFGDDVANNYMIQRLEDIAAGRIQPTQTDLNFYIHELREGLRFDRLQLRSKTPINPQRVWESIHRPTVAEFGLRGRKSDFYLPEALRLEEEALAREFGLKF